uniref:Uncharacterized protein n=1 Tax=Arundo donax TaxID=35708 RepID=A0A0A9BR36_ARUDO
MDGCICIMSTSIHPFSHILLLLKNVGP